MNDLPYCGICGKQIVNAPGIGWYCPTIGCEGDWPQKANIVFDYKTNAQIISEKDKRIQELENALNEAADELEEFERIYVPHEHNDSIEEYRAIANNKG